MRVDPAQIDQVLMNLAVNARDAMPARGHAHRSRRPTWTARRGDAPAHVALTVRDTGHGMDERTRAQAFEPFFTTKAGSGGTGLGLSMVYGIVQQSGGQIAVESEPGRGTSFRILLPRADGAGRRGRGEAAGPRPRRPGGETVLVVEDEPAIRSLACEMLEAHGYRALSAGSGEEALGLAVRHAGPIHLLLTDVVMPGLAGPALAERFAVVRPEARVLFMSGYAGDDLARRGLPEDVVATSFPSPSRRTSSAGGCGKRSTGDSVDQPGGRACGRIRYNRRDAGGRRDMRGRHRSVALAAAGGSAGRPSRGRRGWVEVRSPSFTVVSDGSEKDARKVVLQFEQVRALLQEVWPGARSTPCGP